MNDTDFVTFQDKLKDITQGKELFLHQQGVFALDSISSALDQIDRSVQTHPSLSNIYI